MTTIDGKRVIVTGASGRLGWATAKMFAAKGARMASIHQRRLGWIAAILLGAAVSVAVGTRPVPATPPPLLLGISIHVEGWNAEATDIAAFRIHRDGILALAEEAQRAEAVLTFELSGPFLEGAQRYGDDVVDRLLVLGQGVAIHADVGGSGSPSRAALIADLTALRERLAALGVDATHVSGVCSRGPWVEAALAAGFTSANGLVEYCLTAMDPDNVPAGVDLSACTSPAACHGPIPVPFDQQIYPFYAESSANFLAGTAASGLLLILGESGGTVDCLAEGSSGGGCAEDAADIPIFLATVEQYRDARSDERAGALTYSWSVGSIPAPSYAADLFAAVAPLVAAGDVQWAALPDIAAAAAPTVAATTLVPGFNWVAYDGPAQSTAALVASLDAPAAVGAIFAFDAIRQTWEVYRPDAPPFLSTLSQVEPGHAYVVQARASVTWPRAGSAGAAESVALAAGFTAVPWLGATAIDDAALRNRVGDPRLLRAAYRFDPTTQTFQSVRYDLPPAARALQPHVTWQPYEVLFLLTDAPTLLQP